MCARKTLNCLFSWLVFINIFFCFPHPYVQSIGAKERSGPAAAPPIDQVAQLVMATHLILMRAMVLCLLASSCMAASSCSDHAFVGLASDGSMAVCPPANHSVVHVGGTLRNPQLAATLDELKAEISQLRAELSRCCGASHPPVPSTSGMLYLGGSSPYGLLSSVTNFDFDFMSWVSRSVPSFPTPRSGFVAAAVGSGLFVIGGGDGGSTYLTDHEHYDFVLGKWESRKPMSAPRHSMAGAVVADCIVVAGGERDLAWVADVECYNTTSDTWQELPPLSKERANMAAASVNHTICVMGGRQNNPREYVKTTECYDFSASNGWYIATDMPTARAYAAAVDHGPYIYVVGGLVTDNNIPLNALERFDPAANTWVSLLAMPTPRWSPVVVAFDNNLYVLGGSQTNEITDKAERYIIETNRWFGFPPLPHPRSAGAAVLVS